VSAAVRAALVAVSLALAGCAFLPWPWSPLAVHERHTVAAPHRQKAIALEQKGDLRRALDELKIALTINPEDSAAREGRRRLEARLDGAVTGRVRLGQEALRRGAPLEARRHFLAALALDPTNRAAATALRDEIGDVRFLTHTVARGETLGTIAERYYGDRTRADLLWEANQLPPSPRLSPGTKLRVPEIAGVPFRVPVPAAPTSDPGASPPATGEQPSEDIGPLEVNPLLADAREAVERKEYEVALAAVDRLLEGNPRQPEWVDFKKAILYDYGRARLEQTQYDDAYRTLSQLAKLDPKYRDAPILLGQARAGAMQMHHNEGIRLYREEQLEAAIAHWRAVLEYDPSHVEARRNIEQAERILRTLRDRQRKP
jgi:tetratricopeptide (TPR) repeat protein